MGGCDFTHIETGRDASEAFDRAVQSAQYEYGHGGYTGTIAEKPSYVLIRLPKRVTAAKFLRWVEDAPLSSAFDGGHDGLKKIPEQHRDLVRRALKIYDDKWGAALALELTGERARKVKAARGLKGKRGVRVFLFTGIASE